jgi:hypothetical protein
MGDSTQYTVNNQMVNATLMNIADSPTNVQLPGQRLQQRRANARMALGLESVHPSLDGSGLHPPFLFPEGSPTRPSLSIELTPTPQKLENLSCAPTVPAPTRVQVCTRTRRSPACPSSARVTTSPPCTPPSFVTGEWTALQPVQQRRTGVGKDARLSTVAATRTGTCRQPS